MAPRGRLTRRQGAAVVIACGVVAGLLALDLARQASGVGRVPMVALFLVDAWLVWQGVRLWRRG